MVGILVVGTGSMGWNHARVCSSLDSLVGVCDQSEEASARAGHEFSVPSFTSLDSAIRECSPDALIIATPTTTHLEVLKTAQADAVFVAVQINRQLYLSVLNLRRNLGISEEIVGDTKRKPYRVSIDICRWLSDTRPRPLQRLRISCLGPQKSFPV